MLSIHIWGCEVWESSNWNSSLFCSSDNMLLMVSEQIIPTLQCLQQLRILHLWKSAAAPVRRIFWPIFSVSLNCVCMITFPAVLPPRVVVFPERIKFFVPFVLITRPALYLVVHDRRSSSIAQHILKPWIEKETCSGLVSSFPPCKSTMPVLNCLPVMTVFWSSSSEESYITLSLQP